MVKFKPVEFKLSPKPAFDFLRPPKSSKMPKYYKKRLREFRRGAY